MRSNLSVTTPNKHAPTCVLIVEDNEADAELVRELLADSLDAPPFTIEHVGFLRDALARLAQGGVDLILLDLGLPDSHGLSTVARIVERAPSVPVVVVTGFEDAEIRRQVLDARAEDYLVKGKINTKQLVKYIRGAGQQAAAAPSEPGLGSQFETRRILFFERDHNMYVTVSTILRLRGHEVVAVGGWETLLKELENGGADLILIGLGSTADDHLLIRDVTAATNVPVIALVPPERPSRVVADVDFSRVAATLVKPPSSASLQSAIEGLLAGDFDPEKSTSLRLVSSQDSVAVSPDAETS